MALQKLCIKVIVDKFERYFLAFSKTEDPNLKRNFEFLQRGYSYQIASQLHESEKMQRNYIDFLLNKYLKTLDTEWFEDCPLRTVFAKFAEVGSSLQKIYFSYSIDDIPWEEVIQNVICHLTNLEVFSFHDNCNDGILKCISQFCPNIVEIDVSSSCEVTGMGIKYLCMKKNGKPLCPKLKKVLLKGIFNIKKEDVQYLIKNLRSLEITDFRGLPEMLYSLHGNDLSKLNKVEPYNFTSLNLLHLCNVPHHTNILKICLSVCPRLKSLSCPVSSEEHLDLFSSPLELEKLHLESFSNSDVTNLLKLLGKKLTSLTLCSLCTFSVSTLADSCPCLRHLCLDRVIFQNDDKDITPLFNSLETCIFDCITCDSATAKSISLLKYSPKLEHISFMDCDLSSGELKTEILRCCEYCPIKKVNFTDSVVDINFVKDILLNCHSLKLFTLDNCGLESDHELELYRFAQVLPNNPEINFSDDLSEVEDDLSLYDIDEDYDFEEDFKYCYPPYSYGF